jgi:hypothetical protein
VDVVTRVTIVPSEAYRVTVVKPVTAARTLFKCARATTATRMAAIVNLIIFLNNIVF